VPKIKKKRVGFVLDMTPLVDIAFLLLTFFMFTAKFKSDEENEKKFTIVRPKASADTSKLPEKDLATISIAIDSTNGDTSYYYAILNEQIRGTVMQEMTNLPEDQKDKALIKVPNLEVLDLLVAQTRAADPRTKFAIDADSRIKYRWIDDLMEVMRKRKATVFNFVTDKKQ
jgi:biopolymer transport protein ExbD